MKNINPINGEKINMKLLLISDVHHFSTYDCFVGYREALTKLEIPFEYIDLSELQRWYSGDMAWGLVLAKMLNKENAYTDVLFISGILTPEWILASKYDKRVGIIGLDDPHAGIITMNKMKYLDYYFTNCKKMEDKEKKIYYLPTATSYNLPICSKSDIPEAYRSNICFIGTVYNDRIKPLEDICEYAKEKNLIVKIIGPLLNTPKDSIIRKNAQEGIVNNHVAKLVYRGSDIVLNIDRNIKWNPIEKEGNSTLIDVGVPYSTNPRVYEIAGCRTTQLYINPREEVKDIFGDNIYYCGYDNVKEGLDKILNENEDVILEKVNNCFNIVKEKHTYLNRSETLMSYIDKDYVKYSIRQLGKAINS
jgi:hypothetical protein